jgi:MerR family mercuric resistance operon transcriptional regulator
MTIGQLSKETGFTIETIRYYESIGVLPEPKRREAGYRNYSADSISRLGFIKRAKELDFTLTEIKELLKTFNSVDSDNCGDVCSLTKNKLEEVNSKIEYYKQLQQRLSSLIKSCSQDCSTEDCKDNSTNGCAAITSLKQI